LVPENSGSCKIRGLFPPSSWCWRIQGVVTSFRLVPVNQGVGVSFQLVLENLEVGASYGCILDIYIRKHSVVFSDLGFHVNYGVLCMWLFDVMILLMVIFS
jgi:hypothetical protein